MSLREHSIRMFNGLAPVPLTRLCVSRAPLYLASLWHVFILLLGIFIHMQCRSPRTRLDARRRGEHRRTDPANKNRSAMKFSIPMPGGGSGLALISKLVRTKDLRQMQSEDTHSTKPKLTVRAVMCAVACRRSQRWSNLVLLVAVRRMLSLLVSVFNFVRRCNYSVFEPFQLYISFELSKIIASKFTRPNLNDT